LHLVHDAGRELALTDDTCLQILREARHLDGQNAMCCVDFGQIPVVLDAAESKQYLLETGHVIVPPSRWRFLRD
jgi:hypothetical protein